MDDQAIGQMITHQRKLALLTIVTSMTTTRGAVVLLLSQSRRKREGNKERMKLKLNATPVIRLHSDGWRTNGRIEAWIIHNGRYHSAAVKRIG